MSNSCGEEFEEAKELIHKNYQALNCLLGNIKIIAENLQKLQEKSYSDKHKVVFDDMDVCVARRNFNLISGIMRIQHGQLEEMNSNIVDHSRFVNNIIGFDIDEVIGTGQFYQYTAVDEKTNEDLPFRQLTECIAENFRADIFTDCEVTKNCNKAKSQQETQGTENSFLDDVDSLINNLSCEAMSSPEPAWFENEMYVFNEKPVINCTFVNEDSR